MGLGDQLSTNVKCHMVKKFRSINYTISLGSL